MNRYIEALRNGIERFSRDAVRNCKVNGKTYVLAEINNKRLMLDRGPDYSTFLLQMKSPYGEGNAYHGRRFPLGYDISDWILNRLQSMLRDSEVMESLGYSQFGFCSFSRTLSNYSSFMVYRVLDLYDLFNGGIESSVVYGVYDRYDPQDSDRMHMKNVPVDRVAVLLESRHVDAIEMNSLLRDRVIGEVQ